MNSLTKDFITSYAFLPTDENCVKKSATVQHCHHPSNTGNAKNCFYEVVKVSNCLFLKVSLVITRALRSLLCIFAVIDSAVSDIRST